MEGHGGKGFSTEPTSSSLPAREGIIPVYSYLPLPAENAVPWWLGGTVCEGCVRGMMDWGRY